MRNCFPQFDKYWENEKNQKEGLQKIKGKDIKLNSGYSLASTKDENAKNSDASNININKKLNGFEEQIYEYTGEIP